MNASEIKTLRTTLKLSQAGFAKRYSIPIRTLQQWEEDCSKPDASARILLLLISRAPQTIAHILAGWTERETLVPPPKEEKNEPFLSSGDR